MAPEQSRGVQRATFLLMALAAVAVEVAAADGRAVLQSVGLAAALVAIAALVGRLVPLPADPRRPPPRWLLLLLVPLAAAPFAIEPLRRSWTGTGYALEIQMVCGLRNVGLGLAACAAWLLCLRLACMVSLFLILIAVALTSHPVVMAVLGLYAAAGSGWLVLLYWAGLKTVFVAADTSVPLAVQGAGRQTPWLGLALLVLVLGGAAALIVLGPRRAAAFTLGQWMPTSGGSGDTDPFARAGVGDGPEETAGDNARAAGMVETERSIEDNEQSLIDAVSDMYGPPHKPPKLQERMVAGGKVDVIQNHGRLPDSRRPSRDFDTARKGPKDARKSASRQARGLFEVQGRTPLHVRLVAYDRYDAARSQWREAARPGHRLLQPEGGDWMNLGQIKDAGWYLRDERHRLKVADLRTNLVPTPALLTRFRIHRVDKPEYYGWDYEGILVLAGRKRTPPGVVVTTDCRTLDPRRLPAAAFRRTGKAPEQGEVPDALRAEMERIAREWAGDRPRGWPQVEAVLARLRSQYVLDPKAAAPADHPAPVLWFLTVSRRGPDYLFATAAALLLRALHYPARVCLGYYAAPEAYDSETGHTPVKASDLHFWPEVLLGDGHWLVVEPTPGYDVLGPSLPLSERVLAALAAAAAWMWRHIVELAVLVAVLGAGWVCRRQILDGLAVRLWRWFPGRTWREQVRGAVAVLERRGRWAGKARPRRQTVPTWLSRALPRSSQEKADIDRLTRLAEWAAYAPDGPPPWPEGEVRAVCRRALESWTLGRWRRGQPIVANGAGT